MSALCAAAGSGAAPPIRASATAMVVAMCFMAWFLPIPSLDDDLAVHPGLEMTRDQTGIFELATLGETPDELSTVKRRQPRGVRIVVLHVRELLHHRGVFPVVGLGGQHELVIPGSIVSDDEADRRRNDIAISSVFMP